MLDVVDEAGCSRATAFWAICNPQQMKFSAAEQQEPSGGASHM